jgi:RNA-directed DNA polymerase
VRYADDIAIFVSSPRAAERILESVVNWIEKRLKVPVNREKSGSGPTEESALLGFRLHANGEISVAPKNIQRLKEKVRELWEARQSLTSNQFRDQWRRYIIGWWNYFQLATNYWDVRDTTGWIRRHIRKCFWLRWKTPRGRRNALKSLGIKHRALGIAGSGIGAWRIAKFPPLQQALSNKTLERYGFIIPWNFAKAPSKQG